MEAVLSTCTQRLWAHLIFSSYATENQHCLLVKVALLGDTFSLGVKWADSVSLMGQMCDRPAGSMFSSRNWEKGKDCGALGDAQDCISSVKKIQKNQSHQSLLLWDKIIIGETCLALSRWRSLQLHLEILAHSATQLKQLLSLLTTTSLERDQILNPDGKELVNLLNP